MTEYYVQVNNNGFEITEIFWSVDSEVAHRDINPSTHGTFRAIPGEEMIATLRRTFTDAQFFKSELAPGQYFPRMARPSSTRPECSPGHNPDQSASAINIRTTGTGQLHALIQKLQQICMVVHPTSDNFGTYGHEIRNIIIIACTEVEAYWKNILKENDVKGTCTRDYAKLSLPMKLGEYRVALPWYPWLEPIAPFENWKPSETPSKSLPWYDAYNAVKHDRENNFAQATLINALTSVTGCFVMLCAQYGWDFARRGDVAADAFFQMIDAPKWQPSEIYIPPYGPTLTARYYPFGT